MRIFQIWQISSVEDWHNLRARLDVLLELEGMMKSDVQNIASLKEDILDIEDKIEEVK